MGQQTIYLVLGVLLLGSILVLGLTRTNSDMTRNSTSVFMQEQADHIDESVLEIAMRTLADSAKWRAPISNLQLFGGSASVTFKDTMVAGDSAIVVRSRSFYASHVDTAWSTSRVIVKPRSEGFVPPIVRAAFTTFGPLNDVISDMFIDGRDFQTDGVTINPLKGVYAVSTGQPSFVNTHMGSLGGTSYSPTPVVDLPTAYPENPRTVELSSVWPHGWPTNPDAALEIPVGTLKSIAQKKSIPGSQYVTDPNKLVKPLRGVTFVDVDPGEPAKGVNFGDNPSGIFVYHSSATDAFAQGLNTKSGPFTGLMIFDNAFHIHMNILGAIVLLTPNTVVGKNCAGNKDHWVRFSSAAIKAATKGVRNASGGGGSSGKGGWRNSIAVVSWYH